MPVLGRMRASSRSGASNPLFCALSCPQVLELNKQVVKWAGFWIQDPHARPIPYDILDCSHLQSTHTIPLPGTPFSIFCPANSCLPFRTRFKHHLLWEAFPHSHLNAGPSCLSRCWVETCISVPIWSSLRLEPAPMYFRIPGSSTKQGSQVIYQRP